MSKDPLLELKHVTQHFPISRSLTIEAVKDVSFSINPGQIVGLVGESGAGKSTLARSIMGLYRLTSGEVWFQGENSSNPNTYRKNRRSIHKNMQMIFQDSAAALNPRMTVVRIIAEPMTACGLCSGKELSTRIITLLEQVGLDESFCNKRPNELSGGQRQRVAIARAISTNPQLLVADEPVASLDVSIQAQILTLFQELQREYGFAFLLIAHDLSVIRLLCNTVGVMRQGHLLEFAECEELFQDPLHPYTKSLLSAIPTADPIRERSRKVLEFDSGSIPEAGTFHEVVKGHFLYE
ncbi:ATP-binding cassette domain-containing protein [Clostridium merdae]|uniref:ATP-binding cassette domain-containing protein n=1 Tax=Clostridium merdae TaxID=1958780 RepID=UPI000A26AB75|nr:ATP-binding cassette domain-containing protein [Clostridium merdae]